MAPVKEIAVGVGEAENFLAIFGCICDIEDLL
jgi:hypothetical protein